MNLKVFELANFYIKDKNFIAMNTQNTDYSDTNIEAKDSKVSIQLIHPEYCGLPQIQEREFDPSVSENRSNLIRDLSKKWVNGTILHYYFFDKETDGENIVLRNGQSRWIPWTTSNEEKEIVRQAFKIWADIGIGISFKEVDIRDEAEIRIGFMRGNGAWSYLGRDIIDIASSRDERTMNFGWDLTRSSQEIDTAIHEIGHTLGLHHEHQNPKAGIVWNEDAVYSALAGPPNNWPEDVTYRNIIRKVDSRSIDGSSWDPDSIMHYPFGAGLIEKPEEFRGGVSPEAGLSERDKSWIKQLYPIVDQPDVQELFAFDSSRLKLNPGEQRNFIFKPEASRYYNIQTFGISDTVMVLFEDENENPRYLSGDDDSGTERNAYIRQKLLRGRTYIIRIRLYFADSAGETSVMVS